MDGKNQIEKEGKKKLAHSGSRAFYKQKSSWGSIAHGNPQRRHKNLPTGNGIHN